MEEDEHLRTMPPDIFVRLRQEMAASRINKLLYSTNNNRFSEGAATTYMSLEADRLREERGAFDGVNKGEGSSLPATALRISMQVKLTHMQQTLRNCITAQ